MTWFTWILLALAMLVIGAGALTVLGAERWDAMVALLARDLQSGRDQPATACYDVRETAGLPEPVQRYFRAVLTDGQPVVSAATIRMTGSFNMSASGERWRPFTSVQRVATHRPGFLWDARIALLPGISVRVVDSFIAGRGLLRAALQGLIPVADQRGGGEIAQGEFMRYFAESPWYPTALLPSQGVQWEAVDAHSAYATLADGGLTLRLLFRFDGAGLIAEFRADSRGALVGNAMVHAPWEGRFADYRRRDGMLVPFSGQVAWLRPEGRKTYFKGTVTQLDYAFAQ
jgi:hypothetical protein